MQQNNVSLSLHKHIFVMYSTNKLQKGLGKCFFQTSIQQTESELMHFVWKCKLKWHSEQWWEKAELEHVKEWENRTGRVRESGNKHGLACRSYRSVAMHTAHTVQIDRGQTLVWKAVVKAASGAITSILVWVV